MKRHVLLASLAAVVLGCKNPDDDLAPAFVPKSYAFEGDVDPMFAGKWKTDDGTSILDLTQDGTLKVQTVTPSPAGKRTSNVDGKWRVSSGSLLMQYGATGGGNTVLKYGAKLEGDSMTLQQEGGRTRKVYHRK